MLNAVIKALRQIDRTPAWLCRQAGVHRSLFTNIKNGRRKLTDNIKDKFSAVLGIEKEILFKQEQGDK